MNIRHVTNLTEGETKIWHDCFIRMAVLYILKSRLIKKDRISEDAKYIFLDVEELDALASFLTLRYEQIKTDETLESKLDKQRISDIQKELLSPLARKEVCHYINIQVVLYSLEQIDRYLLDLYGGEQ